MRHKVIFVSHSGSKLSVDLDSMEQEDTISCGLFIVCKQGDEIIAKIQWQTIAYWYCEGAAEILS